MSAEHPQDLVVSETPLQAAFQSNQMLSAYRRDWELGRWDQLAKLDYTACESEADSASLALIVATANQATGNLERVRECVDFAITRGCSRATVLHVLAAGVHNTLGRARLAACEEKKAIRQFQAATEIGAREGRLTLVAAGRCNFQRAALGFEPPSPAETGPPAGGVDSSAAAIGKPGRIAEAKYRRAPQALVEDEAAPFVLLDSKSLPRSGLHYLRSSLERALGSQFSFCEWYQEPGCCRQQPCALTGFLECRSTKYKPSIRLVKSHDFDLTDRIVDTGYSLRRVVLRRDPLYVLTSWWALDQLEAHEDILASAGLRTEKILLAHEPEMVRMAYRILETHFVPPSRKILQSWIEEKVRYIQRFSRKWIDRTQERRDPYFHLVDYTEIDSFVVTLLRELGAVEWKKDVSSQAVGVAVADSSSFQPRRDAFRHSCPPIEDYFQKNSDLFSDYANRIQA